MKNLRSFYLILLCLGGCFNSVHNDIPPNQIAMKSDSREGTAIFYYMKGQFHESEGKLGDAVKAYSYVTKYYLETEVAPKTFHAYGQLLLKQNKLEEAFEKLRFITKNYVNYEAYSQVIIEEFEIACQLMKRFEEKLNWKVLSFFKDPEPIIKCFQHIIGMAPYAVSAPKSLFYIAQLEYKYGDKAKAIESLDRLINDYPGSEYLPDAYLLQAEIYLSFVNSAQNDQGMTKKAIDCYEDFFVLFGEQEAKFPEKMQQAKSGLEYARNLYAESRLVLGDFYLYRRHYPQGALVFYNEARLIAPVSKISDIADGRMDFINCGKMIPANWADFCFGKVIYKPVR